MASGAVADMRAESLYHVARVFHAEGDHDEAFKYYYQATITAPDFILPQYGLGQMLIARGEVAKACDCFELILKSQVGWPVPPPADRVDPCCGPTRPTNSFTGTA